MKVVVVGAGAAGLVAAKHVSANGFCCDVLEMRPQLGGTWIYTDDVDEDEYGFPVYSATYISLRANIPKEVMGFPDFQIPDCFETYSTHGELLKFLEMYADAFSLKPLIKFDRMVTDIRPVGDTKWLVTSVDKISKIEIVDTYDAVMLCSGNYNHPNLPSFPGKENFRGKQLHSREYRTPDPYKGQNVLVVGAGPSGADLALEVSRVANKVIISNHSNILKTKYPPNVERKPDILCIKESEIEFVDGTSCCVDVIFYCTGFKYSFPYLHDSCGIQVNDNFITPLYKHMIHMEKPSMCFVGIPVQVCAFPMFDLQARCFVNYLNGSMKLPSLEQMREDTAKDMEGRWERGFRRKEAHKMGCYQYSYYKELAQLSDTSPLPSVIVKVRDRSFERFYEDLSNFRQDRYKIVDDDTFEHFKL